MCVTSVAFVVLQNRLLHSLQVTSLPGDISRWDATAGFLQRTTKILTCHQLSHFRKKKRRKQKKRKSHRLKAKLVSTSEAVAFSDCSVTALISGQPPSLFTLRLICSISITVYHGYRCKNTLCFSACGVLFFILLCSKTSFCCDDLWRFEGW